MKRELHILDADKKIAGRLASTVSTLLQGKHKVEYQAHTDCGDKVNVINVAKLAFTGKKLEDKLYHRTTGYPGGIRTRSLGERFAQRPEDLFRHIVYRMLPKNKLRDTMIKRLTFEDKGKS